MRLSVLLLLWHQVRIILVWVLVAPRDLLWFSSGTLIIDLLSTEWVGDIDSDTGGRLGLWQICHKDEYMDSCSGKLEDLLELPTFSFKFATVFGAIAVVTAFLTIFCLVLMLFLKSTTVFHICGWMQLLSGKFIVKRSLILQIPIYLLRIYLQLDLIFCAK